MQGSDSQNQNAKMGSEVDGEPVHHKKHQCDMWKRVLGVMWQRSEAPSEHQ